MKQPCYPFFPVLQLAVQQMSNRWPLLSVLAQHFQQGSHDLVTRRQPRLPRQRYDAIDIKICPDRVTFLSDPICFICLLAMNRVSIFIREDSDGFCSEFVACAERTDSNLAAIGNQNFFKHWCVSVALS